MPQRDEPYTVLTRLGEWLEAVLPTFVETVAQALKLPYVAIALAPEDAKAGETVPEAQNQVVAAVGTPVAEITRLPLTYQGEVVGQMLLAPRTPGEILSAADQSRLYLPYFPPQAGQLSQFAPGTHIGSSPEHIVISLFNLR